MTRVRTGLVQRRDGQEIAQEEAHAARRGRCPLESAAGVRRGLRARGVRAGQIYLSETPHMRLLREAERPVGAAPMGLCRMRRGALLWRELPSRGFFASREMLLRSSARLGRQGLRAVVFVSFNNYGWHMERSLDSSQRASKRKNRRVLRRRRPLQRKLGSADRGSLATGYARLKNKYLKFLTATKTQKT